MFRLSDYKTPYPELYTSNTVSIAVGIPLVGYTSCQIVPSHFRCVQPHMNINCFGGVVHANSNVIVRNMVCWLMCTNIPVINNEGVEMYVMSYKIVEFGFFNSAITTRLK